MEKINYGDRFGKWTVIGQRDGKLVDCVCSCGNAKKVNVYNLMRGKSTMCVPCAMAAKVTKHGLSKTAEYQIWKAIKARCYNPSHKNFADYGGRGIAICSKWINAPESFIKDMGKRPSKAHSIDRIDHNGDYSPDNCKWATQKEQMQNTRRNIVLEYSGESKTVAEWAEKIGIKESTIYHRIAAGWGCDKALSTPVRVRK